MSTNTSGEGTRVLLNHVGNLGYAPDQVRGMTLGDLLAAVEEAVTEWGEDAEVVLQQTNNGHGANFGHLCRWGTFAPTDEEEEDQ